MTSRWIAAMLAVIGAGASLAAAELEPQTIAGFDRYVRVTEDQLGREPYLRLDALPAARRVQALAQLRSGGLSIEAVRSLDRDRAIDVPGGLVHHWVGTAFVPRATPDDALSILQDYDRHERIYAPTVDRSRLLDRNGDRFRFFLRFRMKKVTTVVVNSEHEARFTRGTDRAQAWIRSTRIAEVDDPGGPAEREKPVGRDGGYLWRLNTYWRLLARDGGLYIQCESVSLTRGIPAGFGWLVGPFVTSIPRESLAFTLEATRNQLMRTRTR